MNKANDVFERLHNQINLLKRELDDINMRLPDSLSSNGFEYTFDVFFDNVFVDFIVQFDIKKALTQLDELESHLQYYLQLINEQLSYTN